MPRTKTNIIPFCVLQEFERANVSVSYGPPSNPTAFFAQVIIANDTWLYVRSAEGFGIGLSITVTVSGQTAVSTSTGLAYGVSAFALMHARYYFECR